MRIFTAFFSSSFDDKYANSVSLLCLTVKKSRHEFFFTNSVGFIAYGAQELNFSMKIFMRLFISHEDLHENFIGDEILHEVFLRIYIFMYQYVYKRGYYLT